MAKLFPSSLTSDCVANKWNINNILNSVLSIWLLFLLDYTLGGRVQKLFRGHVPYRGGGGGLYFLSPKGSFGGGGTYGECLFLFYFGFFWYNIRLHIYSG